MTEKQKPKVDAIIAYFGWAHVESYIRYFYKDASLSELTRGQAQKIITGLGILITRPVLKVYKRDVA